MKRIAMVITLVGMLMLLAAPALAQNDLIILAGEDCVEVNVNTADEQALQAILHIGPDRAAQIVELREQQPFQTFADLARIDGINGEGIRRAEIVAQHEACLEDNDVDEDEVTPVREEDVEELPDTGAPSVLVPLLVGAGLVGVGIRLRR